MPFVIIGICLVVVLSLYAEMWTIKLQTESETVCCNIDSMCSGFTTLPGQFLYRTQDNTKYNILIF